MKRLLHAHRAAATAAAALTLALALPASAPAFSLKVERAAPHNTIYSAMRAARFEYRIGGHTSRQITIQLVKRGSGKLIRAWHRLAKVGRVQSVRWHGQARNGSFPGGGAYFFRVRGAGGAPADRKGAKGARGFHLYENRFPLLSRHTFGDGFGAGRGHQGVDIFTPCGRPVIAAHAGRVQFRDYQASGAGNYLVIDAKRSARDHVYMHLRYKPRVRVGDRVRAGQRIATVGRTGRASGCHLHFELWNGDWYGGGHPMAGVKPALRRWDSWS